MSRAVSTANALWAQMLGRGNSTSRNRQLVAQYGGLRPMPTASGGIHMDSDLPVTTEALSLATQGMGNTGREALVRQLLGGPANPFVSPPGLATPNEYGYIEMNGEVMQDEPSRAAVERRKMMELLQAKEVAEQRTRALGTLAGRSGPDAQAARQELGIPVSPGYENLISPEQDRVIRTRLSQEAAQRAQIEKFANQPGATQANIDELWQQHNQQFPEFAGGQRPKTRAEQLDEMQRMELATYQQAVGDVPLARDAKGQIAVIPGYAEAQRAKGEQLRMAESARMDAYKQEIQAVDFSDPIRPDRDAPPEEVEAYTQRLAHNQRRRQLIHNRYFGGVGQQRQQPEPPDQNSSLPVNRAQFDTYRQQAQAAGVALVADQDDYDALEPGEKFIDVADGLEYEKPLVQ